MNESNVEHEFEYKGYQVKIGYSNFSENPRHWGSVFKFVTTTNGKGPWELDTTQKTTLEDCLADILEIDIDTHKGYQQVYQNAVSMFGPYHKAYPQIDDTLIEYLEKLVEINHLMLPVYCYEHGSIMYGAGSNTVPSGVKVGYIFIPKSDARANFGKRLTKKVVKLVYSTMVQEVANYSCWVNGDDKMFEVYKDGNFAGGLMDIYEDINWIENYVKGEIDRGVTSF